MNMLETQNERIGNYKRDFGHKFEENLAMTLKNELGDLVEETEMATPKEDQVDKVDVWVKFWGIPDPVALQVTFTSNESRMTQKEKSIATSPLAKKEDREDSLIKVPGTRSSNRVLVYFDKNRIQAGKIDRRMLADTFRQIMDGLPSHSRALFLKTIGERMKKAGKQFPA